MNSNYVKALLAVFFIFTILSTGILEKALAAGSAEANRYHSQIEAYENRLEQNPGDEELLLELARLCDAAGWYGKSVTYWEMYIDKYPDGEHIAEARRAAATAHRWIGVQFYQNGEDIDAAVERIRRAIGIDPNFLDAYYWLARIYKEQDQLDKAEKALEDALDIDPDNERSLWLLKQVRGSSRVSEKAYKSYTDAYALYEKGDIKGALRKYNDAVTLAPDFSKAHYWIARIYMEQEMYAAAAKKWRKVLELDPGNKNAKWFLQVAEKELKKQSE